jgi:hypothetical protein
MPSVRSLHVDVPLTNFSLMYRNPSYVADVAMPVVPVAKRADKYFTYDQSGFLSPSPLDAQGRPSTLRRPGTEAAEIDYSVGTSVYFAEEYAARGIVTDAEVAIADSPMQPDMDQTIQLTERLMLDNEIAVVGIVAKRANYPAGNKVALTGGGTGTSWAQYASANSLPFTDIKNAKLAVQKGLMKEANTFLAGIDTCRTLADHPLVKDLVKYTHQDALTTSGLPKVMRGLDVVEANGQKNTAAEGAAFAGGQIWLADDSTSMALIFYRNPTPTIKSVAFGYTFEAPDDASKARGFAVRRWREDKRKGNMIEVSFMRDWRLIAVDSNSKAVGGYLISNATA